MSQRKNSLGWLEFWAFSFRKKINQSTATHHDIDTIHAMTLTWNIAEVFLPTEVITATTEATSDIGLLKLATCNMAEGTGYRISIGSKEYNFPLHKKAPCKGPITQK
ncbi:hypothetical protein C8R45DRAFT_1111193 [Mycena sanguinolenta]|nr:hypothetical protein C8R45DRAFT_1111193 [Mycena sanguinolenta]